jgi:hypothetical protein
MCAGSETSYTSFVNRRFVAFLVMLAIGLQGPSLAYAAALTAKSMPTGCANHVPGQSGYNNSSCCPDNMAPGLCCAGGVVFGGTPTLLLTRISVPARLLPADSGSVAFATQRPPPPLRPPIA